MDGVNRRVRSRSGRARTTGFDDGGATLLYGGNEVRLEPRVVTDGRSRGSAGHSGVVEVGVLRRRVVTPDGEVLHSFDGCAGLLGDLRLGAVLVEAGHREPAVGGNFRRVGTSDQAVGVARVSDNQHPNVASGVGGNGASLGLEDATVDVQQVAALHTGLAGNRTNEQSPVGAVEGVVEVTGGLDAGEQWEGAVVEFHDDAFERLHSGLDFEQTQDDRLVGSKEGAGGNAEQELVADLARSAGNGDVLGGGHVLSL